MVTTINVLTTRPQIVRWNDPANGSGLFDFSGQAARIYFAEVVTQDAGVGGPSQVSLDLTIPGFTEFTLIRVTTSNNTAADKGKNTRAEFKGCLDLPPGSAITYNPHGSMPDNGPSALIMFDYIGGF